MVKYFYKSLRSISVSEVADFQRGSLVYAETPTPDEQEQLVKKFKLEPGYLEDALDEDEMPRTEKEGGHSYIFVRFAYKKSGGEVDTAPLLIIFGGEFVIIITRTPLPALAWLQSGRINFATTQRAKLVLLLLQHISEQYDLYIGQSSRKIKGIRSRLRNQGITNQDFIDFATIEDELNEFLGSLQPTNATLRRLLVARHMPLFDEDQDIVEDILLNNEQSIEASRSNLQSIENIRDAYSAISANNLNRTLTILTVATIVISLPSFAMGIYSMNIRLPYQQNHWVFWIIMGFNAVLMVSVVYIARKKRII
jgi:magnesium transporter